MFPNSRGAQKLSEEKLHLEIIYKLYPKIKKELIQTNKEYREDLEQHLLELIITKLRTKHFTEVAGFFDFVKENRI